MKRFFPLNSTHIHLCLSLLLILFIGACKKNDLVLYTPKPTPDFKYTLSSDKLTVTFKDSSMNAGSWFWNFGDGSTATVQNPSAHTFTANPITSRDTTYFVKLIITNVEKTRKDSIVKPVVIGTAKIPPTDNRIIVGNTEYGFLNKKIETIIPFGGDTKNAIGCRFDWDFGPGEDTAANTQVTRHSFKHTGNYTVTLTITSPSGGVAQVSYPVNVNVFKGVTISQFIWSTPNHLLFNDWATMLLVSGGTPIASTIGGDDIGYSGNQWIWNNTNTSPIPLPCTLLAIPGDLSIGIITRMSKNTGPQEYPVDLPPIRLSDIFNAANDTDKMNLLNGQPADVAIPWTINKPPDPPITGSFIFTLKLIIQL